MSFSTLAYVAAGCAINWTVLAAVYGQPMTATGVTVAMIGLTWVRSYAIRKVFRGLYG